MMLPNPMRFALAFIAAIFLIQTACLPPAPPYPHRDPADVVADALEWSGDFEAYIQQWSQGTVPSAIPDQLIPKGIGDSQNFYLKDPEQVTPQETWAVRYAKPINKDSLYAGIPDPRVTYLYLGTALAPFGSKLILEGEFPHCRFFSIQATPPLNGKEYYAQRQFGTAEVSLVDADIEPLPGHTNPFRVGADRTAPLRKYRVELELTTGDPTALNEGAHDYPYRKNNNVRQAAMLTCQGPLGFKTVVGTPLANPGEWDLGALWLRIYAPDDNKGPLGGVPMPKVWYELPDGTQYFVGSDFSTLVARANKTAPNRITAPANDASVNPQTGWFKSWGITRSMLNGVCQVNGWSRPDSSVRVNEIDLGWTGRGEFQAPPGNIEPHATTNNYASYLGRSMTVPPGMVAVLTGKLPTFPPTREGQPVMQAAQMRYWSIVGIDADALSPLPATTLHAISDDEVVLDGQRNYVIAYSRPEDRPANASANNGVSWVNWGTQSTHGLLMRWVCVAPDWVFPFAPQEHNLSWAKSDWSGSQYDSTLIGVNWRNGFMQCYLPKIHYLTKAEFEALGDDLDAEKIPVWVDASFTVGPSEGLLGTVTASSVLDNSPANAAANANDGNVNTAWSSAFGAQNAGITLDLGSSKVISAVKLHWDWVFFAKNYTVDISDDQNTWTTIATATGENGQLDIYKNFPPLKARFVRLNLSLYNAGWYRLAEFEVFTNDCNCDAPASQATALPRSLQGRVFPNPASERVFYTAKTTSLVDVALFDAQGARRIESGGQPSSGSIPVHHLPPGMYWLTITDDRGRGFTRPLVVYR